MMELVTASDTAHLISESSVASGASCAQKPATAALAIPSFSLHFFTQVYEYYKYSSDDTLLREVYPKLRTVMKAFTDRMDGSGCIPSFTNKEHWNFYEWIDGLSGELGKAVGESYEAALNVIETACAEAMAEERHSFMVKLASDQLYNDVIGRLSARADSSADTDISAAMQRAGFNGRISYTDMYSSGRVIVFLLDY